MLKTKRGKIIFIAMSLLLVSAANGYNQYYSLTNVSLAATEADTTGLAAAVEVANTSQSKKHKFDDTGICSCLPSLNDEDCNKAPKIRLNQQAAKFSSIYIRKNSADLNLTKSRSARYFKIIDTVFTKYRLPLELKYLAVVESDLKPTACSRVGALGLWQFMPATAKDLGLKRGKKWDERTHTYKSTVAAAKYLKDLHKQFGDWLLVIAAYNSGPGPVYAAIKKSGSRNFWKLQKYLPAESRGHVKRYIATHYYFEKQGGVTTLTKSELESHIKDVARFNLKLQQQQEEKVAFMQANVVNE